MYKMSDQLYKQQLLWLTRRIRFLEPIQPERTDFLYNNHMFTLLGYASEVLEGGTKWEDLVRAHIFQPLSMSSSSFIHEEIDELQGFATPYIRRDSEVHVTPKEYYL